LGGIGSSNFLLDVVKDQDISHQVLEEALEKEIDIIIVYACLVLVPSSQVSCA
jgi:hypothetical protein